MGHHGENEAIEGWEMGRNSEHATGKGGSRPDMKLHGAACSNVAFASENRIDYCPKSSGGGTAWDEQASLTGSADEGTTVCGSPMA